MSEIVESARDFLKNIVKNFPEDPWGLIEHVSIVERWTEYILEKHPEADKEITLLGVWLHDCGHYPIIDEDHAVTGEKRAREFLMNQNYPVEKIERVAHIVRSHRCKDVMPQTIEAKILACADSASHFTDFVYLDILMKNKGKERAYSATGKIERDYRDLAIFPEVKEKLEPLYNLWKELLTEFQKINEEI